MRERDAAILTELVRHYIRTARPVGSAALLNDLPWEISSATVRAALQALEEEGFVYQPHTSAGRIPTDRGYRYFVDAEPAPALAERRRQQLADELRDLTEQCQEMSRTLSLLAARASQLLAVCAEPEQGRVADAGLKELLSQPDPDLVDAVREISVVLDQADTAADDLSRTAAHDSAVYIGEEIPLLPARHMSLIVREVTDRSGHRLVLILAGPKRMNYRRNTALLNAIAELVRHNNPNNPL